MTDPLLMRAQLASLVSRLLRFERQQLRADGERECLRLRAGIYESASLRTELRCLRQQNAQMSTPTWHVEFRPNCVQLSHDSGVVPPGASAATDDGLADGAEMPGIKPDPPPGNDAAPAGREHTK